MKVKLIYSREFALCVLSLNFIRGSKYIYLFISPAAFLKSLASNMV